MRSQGVLRKVNKGRFSAVIILASAIFAAATTDAGATVCRFRAGAPAIAFGNLDPGLGTNVIVNTVVQYRCRFGPPWNFAISDDDGLYETGPNLNRMRNTATPTEFLPYALTYAPAAGVVPNQTWQVLTITGAVQGVNYQDAAQGNYTDSVTLTILP